MHNRQRSKDQFLQRAPITENSFLAACAIAPSTTAAHQAISVRRAIADLAEVPESAISADDVFAGGLDQLGMWDSLDTLEFVLQLEKHLGRRISNQVRDRLPGLDDAVRDQAGYSVRDMVVGIVEFLRAETVGT